MLSPERVQKATGCPQIAVQWNWPMLRGALEVYQVGGLLSEIGLAATVAVETAYKFAPIEEFASGEAYDTGRLAERLGNSPAKDGDGQRYKGRGFIQLTGHDNYREAGIALGLDLLEHPNLALDAGVSAQIAGWYWKTHMVNEACDQRDWKRVRKLVNGGLNGWEPFKRIVDRLLG